MLEGIFGRIEGGCVIGWAYDTNNSNIVNIKVMHGQTGIAEGSADIVRPDLIDITKLQKGKVGYKIRLPKGPKEWNQIEVYANGQQLEKAPHLKVKIEKSRQTLTLEMDNPHFFIHIPKTAGTAFKKLLEEENSATKFFPSKANVIENGGLYPHLHELIKLDQPKKVPSILIGHYPYATKQIVKGKLKKIVILRDPVQRAISNIFHMKNNDPRMKNMTPEEIYKVGQWHFSNLQVRYMVDKGIHPNMRYLDAKPLSQSQLKMAIANLRSCDVVGISADLDKTVVLANKMLGWVLKEPKKVNIAKSPKVISDQLKKRIIAGNKLDQRLFNAAKMRFHNLCQKHGV